jgi:tetratricopeptide (TPR) repeat protein
MNGPSTEGRGRIHTVAPGETLSEIAMAYYGTFKTFGTLDALKSANGIRNAQEIRVGQRLRIPPVKVDGRWMPQGAGPARSSTRRRPAAPPAVSPEIDPGTGNAHARGNAALAQGRYDEAVSRLQRAHREAPGDREVRRDLATALYQQAVGDYEAGELVAARNGFERALQFRPDCQECRAYLAEIDDRAAALLTEGRNRYAAGRYAEAAALLERVLRLDPDRTLAAEYRFRAHFDRALERFARHQEGGRAADRDAARSALTAARRADDGCAPCREYAESVKKRLYNEGIRFFTEKGSEQMERAIRVWERVQFVDADYRDVAGNIAQARRLLEKLRDI